MNERANMDFSLSPANKTDKLKSTIGHTNRVEILTNGYDWLASRRDIEEVTVEKLSEENTCIEYIFKMSLKL